MRTQDTSLSVTKAVCPAFEGLGLPSAGAPLYASARRLLDVTCAALLLLLFAPVLLLVSLAVMLDSPGLPVFRQMHTGRNGKTVAILKFRSTYEVQNGADVTQALKDDPRITRVGRILRKFSLDELPQLFNVLTGDMSLVGHRPQAVVHDIYFGAAISNGVVRQQARPGMTGRAQVNGARGATPTLAVMRERITFDIWYVENASLPPDLVIQGRTPLKVLRSRTTA